MNRVFRADDGTEISENDLRMMIEAFMLRFPDGYATADGQPVDAAGRVYDALAPRRDCVAAMVDASGRRIMLPGEVRCVLPWGHHPWGTEAHHCTLRCGKPYVDPIHSPGHMTAPETWSP